MMLLERIQRFKVLKVLEQRFLMFSRILKTEKCVAVDE
jgi:hypothetical protein